MPSDRMTLPPTADWPAVGEAGIRSGPTRRPRLRCGPAASMHSTHVPPRCGHSNRPTHQQLSAWLVDGKRVSLAGTGRSVTSRVDMAPAWGGGRHAVSHVLEPGGGGRWGGGSIINGRSAAPSIRNRRVWTSSGWIEASHASIAPNWGIWPPPRDNGSRSIACGASIYGGRLHVYPSPIVHARQRRQRAPLPPTQVCAVRRASAVVCSSSAAATAVSEHGVNCLPPLHLGPLWCTVDQNSEYSSTKQSTPLYRRLG